MKKLFLLCLLIPALAYSFTYKNNPQTGKPDLVTTSVADLIDIGTGYVPAATFANYTGIGRVPDTRTVNGQALSSNVTITTISGNAGTATALAANGTNCTGVTVAQGVDASGNAEGCFTPTGTYSLPTATSSVLGGVKPDGTSILNTAGVLSATAASVGAAATNQAMHIGTTSVAINRASGALALTGITSIDGTSAGLSGTPDITIGALTFSSFVGGPGVMGTFSIDTATASGPQEITGLGFKPSKIIFLSSIDSTSQISIGFDDATLHYGVGNNHGITANTWAYETLYSISLYQTSTAKYQGHVSSMDAGGFTVTWVKVGSKTGIAEIFYMAYK